MTPHTHVVVCTNTNNWSQQHIMVSAYDIQLVPLLNGHLSPKYSWNKPHNLPPQASYESFVSLKKAICVPPSSLLCCMQYCVLSDSKTRISYSWNLDHFLHQRSMFWQLVVLPARKILSRWKNKKTFHLIVVWSHDDEAVLWFEWYIPDFHV